MKRGFFFLRECDHPAHETCHICGKAFCHEHLRIQPGNNAPACLDCLGKQMQNARDKEKFKDHAQSPAWGYGYRHTYYDEGYQPFYSGRRTSSDDFFTQHDVRSFESGNGGDPDDENFDAEANTFDS